MFNNFGQFGGIYNNSDSGVFKFDASTFPTKKEEITLPRTQDKMKFFLREHCDCIQCQACKIVYDKALTEGEI